MTASNPTRRAKPSEEGYILLFAVFLMALLVIALGIAAPQIAKSIQRDRDLETYHRGLQYRRAVQLYYRKFRAYPPNADALKETNDIRFLRKQYIDPITGKNDWKPILFGQNKAPTAMGFFGQPLAGGATSIAGIGPGGGNGINGGSGGSLPGGISSIFGGSTTSTTSGSTTSGAGSPGDSSGTNGTDGGTSSTATSGTSTTAGGTSPGSPGSSGQNGQSFGGAGIIGFEPASTKQSIRLYKKKDHYNEWEFTYDPISDTQTMTGGNNGANLNGQPAGSTTSPAGSSPFGGSAFGSSTFGSSTFGSSGTNTNNNSTGTSSGPASPTPQQ
jgi:type II secretory pathway pseudopilin PulG